MSVQGEKRKPHFDMQFDYWLKNHSRTSSWYPSHLGTKWLGDTLMALQRMNINININYLSYTILCTYVTIQLCRDKHVCSFQDWNRKSSLTIIGSLAMDSVDSLVPLCTLTFLFPILAHPTSLVTGSIQQTFVWIYIKITIHLDCCESKL
jgi:hypothetical protein